MTNDRAAAAATVRFYLGRLGVEWAETAPQLFSVRLPGAHKLVTECAVDVGQQGVEFRAFVARRPDENESGVYRWLLQRNLKLYGVAFALDALCDVYLTGRLALGRVTAAELDRVFGTIASTADESFNVILELGFAESIRQEWRWRRSRGESTANLAAFKNLDPGQPNAATTPNEVPDSGSPEPGTG